MSEQIVGIMVLVLGLTAYATAVAQMIQGVYSPSFFSRGVWFLLGIISFLGVLLGGGSASSTILAGTLLVGNTAVFIASYFKGSREFGLVEKICLGLLGLSVAVWLVFDSPYLGLVISLFAHFVGGVPTILRVLKNPESEQAYHWYFFFSGCLVSISLGGSGTLKALLFPIYFAFFDGLVILLVNRKRLQTILVNRG